MCAITEVILHIALPWMEIFLIIRVLIPKVRIGVCRTDPRWLGIDLRQTKKIDVRKLRRGGGEEGRRGGGEEGRREGGEEGRRGGVDDWTTVYVEGTKYTFFSFFLPPWRVQHA